MDEQEDRNPEIKKEIPRSRVRQLKSFHKSFGLDAFSVEDRPDNRSDEENKPSDYAIPVRMSPRKAIIMNSYYYGQHKREIYATVKKSLKDRGTPINSSCGH
jgi:hypothetical protein